MKPVRKDAILRIMGTCDHFSGIQHETCRAGVRYDSVTQRKTETTPHRFACFQDEADGLTCEKAHWLTREEAEQREREHVAAIERHMKAHRAAHDDAKAKGFGKGHGGNSQVTCPLCSGVLHYSVAGYNGHLWGKCETNGCASWME